VAGLCPDRIMARAGGIAPSPFDKDVSEGPCCPSFRPQVWLANSVKPTNDPHPIPADR
jgi:hypothetical protein